MVSVHKTSEKGLNQAYYGGNSFGEKFSDMASWASKASKRESKYQGAQTQSGYAMGYEAECYGQVNYPNHEMSFGMAEFPDKHGGGHNSHLYGNAMSKTKVNGHGDGFRNHSSYGMAQTHPHGYGSGDHTSHGKRHNQDFGYGYGSTPRNHKQSGTGYGFGNHTDYQRTEAYGYEEFEENYTNNGMAQRQPCHMGNGFMKNQAYGPKKKMGYGTSEKEARLYSQTEAHYSNESHYGGARGYHASGGNGSPFYGKAGCVGSPTSHGKNMGDRAVSDYMRRMKDGNDSCSDGNSDSDDDDFGRRKVWVSKAL